MIQNALFKKHIQVDEYVKIKGDDEDSRKSFVGTLLYGFVTHSFSSPDSLDALDANKTAFKNVQNLLNDENKNEQNKEKTLQEKTNNVNKYKILDYIYNEEGTGVETLHRPDAVSTFGIGPVG